MSVWRFTLAALNASGDAETLRFSSGEYDGDAYPYLPYIAQPGLYGVRIRSGGLIPIPAGESANLGEVLLVNKNGRCNFLADYAIDGRSAVLDFVSDTGVVTTVVSGTVKSAPAFIGDQVSIKLRDPQESLSQPLVQAVFAGTNVPPAGVEGTADDIQGKPKPKAYGRPLAALPVLVNVQRQIYQVHDDASAIVTAVYDGGVALTPGTPYSDAATLQSTSPAPGEYRTFQGYFRLGALPTKEVTCDVFRGVLANQRFEAGASGWALAGSGTCVIANDPANAYEGDWVLARTGTDGVPAEIARNATVFPVTPGRGYWVRGATKCSTAAGGAGQAEVGYVWLNSSLAEIAADRHVWTPAVDYVAKEGGFTAPAGAAYAYVSIVTRFQTTGTWYFDAMAGGSTALGHVAEGIATEAGSTVNATDVTAANAAGDVGIYLTEQTPTSDLLDLLANSYGGFWALVGNEAQLKPLVAPASPTFSIEDFEDLELSRDSTGAGENGLPVWRVAVLGDRVEHVQTDVNGAANPARLKTEYREAAWESAAVKARHPLSPQLTIVTCLRQLSDMQALADRIGALFSVRRDTVRVRAAFSPANVAKLSVALRIGAVCTLTSSYLGYDTGRVMTVIAFEFDVQRCVATFSLWG